MGVRAGNTFGMLRAQYETDKRKSSTNRSRYWFCVCECGGAVTVRSDSLLAGKTRDCGCQKRQRVRDQSTTHGLSYSREYTAWKNMLARCYRRSYRQYKDYGGRGIRVCAEWRESFAKFFEDVGPSPGKGFSIDRRENDGDYEKTNVRWATRGEQRANQRRRCDAVMYDGKYMEEWAAELGITPKAAYQRYKRLGTVHMPSKSDRQHQMMEAVAHDAKFAKKVGIPQKVGKDFAAADKATGKFKKKKSK